MKFQNKALLQKLQLLAITFHITNKRSIFTIKSTNHRLIKFLLLFALSSLQVFQSSKCIAQEIKLYEGTIKKSTEGVASLVRGIELNTFTVPKDEHTLRICIEVVINDIKKVTAKNKLRLSVTTLEKGSIITIHDWRWNAVAKNQTLSTNCYFPAGECTISFYDEDNPTQVFAKKVITVNANKNLDEKSKDGLAHDRSNFKIYTCKSVDDNWKAIDVVTKIKAGECINLFFESTVKLKNFGFMRWGIYKLKANGEEEYVNQIDQGIGELQLWKRLMYEECNLFSSAGEYRIYISTKDDADAYYAVNNKNYFARVDLVVE